MDYEEPDSIESESEWKSEMLEEERYEKIDEFPKRTTSLDEVRMQEHLAIEKAEDETEKQEMNEQ